MDFYNEHKDWIYIGAVLAAFFVFVMWNYTKRKPRSSSNKRNFKQRLNDKRKQQ